MKKPMAVDLFSGAGGLTLGLKQAGFRVIGAVEIDSLAAKTYRKNHPRTCLFETDINDINALTFKRKLGIKKNELDLLAGCPPCQGFSSLRTLNGNRRNRDKRNELIFEFLRFVEELKPKAIMMENVPKLIKTSYFKRFIKSLNELGYYYDYDVLNASDYGVPQRRKRVVLLASKYDYIEWAKESKQKVTVKEAIYSLPKPGKSGDVLHDLPENRDPKIVRLIKKIPKNGGSRKELGKKYQLKCHKNSDGFKDVYGRMAWNDVAPTITTGCFNPSKGRFLHPSQNRAITLREAALLQSFPKDYVFLLDRGKGQVAQMIGNALPPEFIRLHAVEIRKHINNFS